VTQQAQILEREVLSGSVERVVFHNPENGFCVLRVQIRGLRELQAVVGRTPAVSAGQWITASGHWVNDSSHGRQFEASHIKASAPESDSGIEKYLGSGAIPGIGPVYAKKLVAEFGSDVFQVIEQEPARLREVPGIGPVRAKRIIEAWDEQKVVREIMIFLHTYGIGSARAARIYKTYGANAVEVMSKNPYVLSRDIRGVGFKVADGIAMKLGVGRGDSVRIRAGISYALSEAMGEGHCGLPRQELIRLATKLLGVELNLIEPALRSEIEAGDVVEDSVEGEPCVFLARLHRAEQGIARVLSAALRGEPPWPRVDTDRAIPWVEKRIDLRLAPSQIEAVRLALQSKVMVITGGPGVGKTTIVNAILKILLAKGVEISLCAPTGRAAKRLSETSGMEAKTIHRLLEFDPGRTGFRRNADKPLDCDLLVVDETSMVDVSLMNSLMRALPRQAALLLVGDVDQLPSVGPGQVLADLINSGAVPVARLVEVFRQAASSRIVVNAHRVNRGELPELGKPERESDFYFVPADQPADAIKKTVQMVRSRIPQRFALDPVRDIQVLCPMNRGGMGARVLNTELQAALNPPGDRKFERFGWSFVPGDKVMQVENDYDRDVYNGDIGKIESIDLEEGTIEVDFDGRRLTYAQRDLDMLVAAFATTIHKSQGSEYPAVVIPIMDQHFVMLQRNLIYTAITRGKRLVVLVGQHSAVRRAVQTSTQLRRWSKLRELVEAGCAADSDGQGRLPGVGAPRIA
jgi:exodeoxyribonuclease V alpha subunit